MQSPDSIFNAVSGPCQIRIVKTHESLIVLFKIKPRAPKTSRPDPRPRQPLGTVPARGAQISPKAALGALRDPLGTEKTASENRCFFDMRFGRLLAPLLLQFHVLRTDRRT